MRTVTETPEEALARIQSMGFCNNDALAIMAFSDAGIPPDDIDPRNNVLTFRAWKAKGRQVAKGATSVRVTVWIPKKGKQDEEAPKDGEKKASGGMYPKTTSLFHVSQTIELGAGKGTRPDAWANPKLVKAGTYAPEETPVADDDGVFRNVPGTSLDFSLKSTDDGSQFDTFIEAPAEPDEFGAQGDDRPAECICPMVGCVTHVDCPLHGERVTA